MSELIPGDLSIASAAVGEFASDDGNEPVQYWLACAELATAMRRESAERGSAANETTDRLRTLEQALWTAYVECVGREIETGVWDDAST